MFGTNGSVGNSFISNKAWIRGLNVGDFLPKGTSDGEKEDGASRWVCNTGGVA